jgi:capsular exopolysaccharide synthesis family protein
MAVTGALMLAAGAAYLALAPRVYRATSTVMVAQGAPKALHEGPSHEPDSDTYLQTQAEIVRSSRVLERAVSEARPLAPRTLGEPAAAGELIGALKRGGGGFTVEVPRRRSDALLVTMESRWPAEAAAFVDAVVRAYVAERAELQRQAGAEMMRALDEERAAVELRRAACAEAMVRCKREAGVLSFRDEPANVGQDATVALARSATAAEVAVMELRGQQKAVRRAVADPAAMEAFVAAQQQRGREFVDPQFEELQRQSVAAAVAAATHRTTLGSMHPRLQMLGVIEAELRARMGRRTREIADAHLASVEAQLAAAEDKLGQLREAYLQREGRAVALGPAAAAYAALEAEMDRLHRQRELLDRRRSEVSVNHVGGAGPLDVRVLEPARVEARPVKPNKPLTLAVALLAGCVAGTGLALVRDYRDVRLRTPQDVRVSLAIPVVAGVPRIDRRLSPVARGQLLRLDPRSAAAEAYRSIRTALRLGVAHDAKTILVASPAEGDGKSTTASNLAIAFAEAGERTLLVDCDLREPVQHLIFGLDGSPGLSGVIADRAKLSDAVCPTAVDGLHVLPCGAVPANPSELLTGKPFGLLVQTLLGAFDRVVFDSPPLANFADARVLGAAADATLLVVRMNQSARHLGLLALDALHRDGANVVGAVANEMAPALPYRRYGGAWEYAARAARAIPAGAGAVRVVNGARPSDRDLVVAGDPGGAEVFVHASVSGNGHGSGRGNGAGNVAAHDPLSAGNSDRPTER